MNKIGYDERKQVYLTTIQHFGDNHQCNKFDEELGEFLKELGDFLTELGRMRNGAGNREAFAEELADLTIMLEQLRLIFDVNEEVCDWMDYKVRRLSQRVSVLMKEGCGGNGQASGTTSGTPRE